MGVDVLYECALDMSILLYTMVSDGKFVLISRGSEREYSAAENAALMADRLSGQGPISGSAQVPSSIRSNQMMITDKEVCVQKFFQAAEFIFRITYKLKVIVVINIAGD
jgi:hypothetical protein